MTLFVLMGLANPMTWLVVTMVYISWSRFRQRGDRTRKGRPLGTSSDAGFGAAFQFLSVAYRPNHAFIAKAQIQQQEDADEDDNGSPDTPIRHLHGQLRRIRRGEPVDRLIWRLE